MLSHFSKRVLLFQWRKCGRQSAGLTLVPTEGSTLGGMAVVGLSYKLYLLHTFVINIVVIVHSLFSLLFTFNA